MSTEPTNPPEAGAVATNLNDRDAFLATSAPPRSWVAWSGFVLGVLLLVPWVAWAFRGVMGNPGLIAGSMVGLGGGLLAALLGILGIFRTRKRVRRGRAVAIAAIPLGVVGGILQLAVGLTAYGFLGAKAEGDQAVQLLRTPTGDAVESARVWRTEHGSARFQAAVSEEALAGWLNEVLAKHGQMQTAAANRKKMFDQSRGAMVYRLNGQFVNGTASIELTIGFENEMQARVDDIRVDGSSPRDWTPTQVE